MVNIDMMLFNKYVGYIQKINSVVGFSIEATNNKPVLVVCTLFSIEDDHYSNDGDRFRTDKYLFRLQSFIKNDLNYSSNGLISHTIDLLLNNIGEVLFDYNTTNNEEFINQLVEEFFPTMYKNNNNFIGYTNLMSFIIKLFGYNVKNNILLTTDNHPADYVISNSRTFDELYFQQN